MSTTSDILSSMLSTDVIASAVDDVLTLGVAIVAVFLINAGLGLARRVLLLALVGSSGIGSGGRNKNGESADEYVARRHREG